MLVIRNEQKAVLENLPRTLFEDQIMQHLNRFYPREYRELGSDQVRVVVQLGIKRAEEHGFGTQRQVGFYVSLMFLLGSDFDRDVQLHWAIAFLAYPLLTDPSQRMERLWESAMSYIDATAGEGNMLLVRALIRIRDFDLASASEFSHDEFEDDICDLLNTFYPQKWAHQGEVTTREMIRWSMESAHHYGLQTNEGLCVFVTLAFMLGIGFHSDPLFPWAGNILSDTTLDADTKSDRIYEAAMAYLDTALAGK